MAATASGVDGRQREPRRARWRAKSAIVAVAGGLVGGQALALGAVVAAGGRAASDATQELALVLGDAVLIVVVLLVARRGANRLGAATLGIRRTAFWPALGWTTALYFAAVCVEGLWAAFVADPTHRATGAAAIGPLTAATALFAGAVVAPIAEEIAFRGYLFPALARRRGPWVGALICGALFGAAHAAVYPPAFLPAMAAFGFALCLLFWFTGSLLPCVLLHAFNNALVITMGLHLGGVAPLAIFGTPIVAVCLLLPFARERAPRPA